MADAPLVRPLELVVNAGAITKLDPQQEVSNLTDVELVTLLTGDRAGAEKLLTEYGAISELNRLAPTDLARCTTRARASRLAVALELGRRASMLPCSRLGG